MVKKMAQVPSTTTRNMNAARGLMAPSIRNAFQRARVNIPGIIEVIEQPLYDYQTLAATAVASQKFFQTPQGQNGKSIADTNMELAGQLPKGQAFAITGIQVEVLPGLDIDAAAASEFANDVYAVLKGGALALRIGSKVYTVQGNLMKFPPVNRLAGFASTGLVTQQIQYVQAGGREFKVIDLLLESSQNFSVELIDLPVLPSGTAGRIGVTLNGSLFRNAQ